MKVKNFKDLQNWTDGPDKEELDSKVEEFVTNLRGCLDVTIAEWVSHQSLETSAEEYKNISHNAKKTSRLDLLNKKDMKKFKSFLELREKIEKLRTQLEKLENYEEGLSIDADSELLYKFQEDLLLDEDYHSFYELFIDKESNEDEINLSDIHPDILKDYKDEIETIIQSKKYNL